MIIEYGGYFVWCLFGMIVDVICNILNFVDGYWGFFKWMDELLNKI